MKYLLIILISLFVFSCKNIKQNEGAVKDKADASEAASRAADAAGRCYSVCNVTKNPDLKIVTNAQDQPQVDGVIDTNTYFWKKYQVRTHPVRLTQNYVTPPSYAIRYGWDSGVVVNRVQLQCLLENIAPFDSTCVNDWEFEESDGYLVGNNYFFDGLFEFETFEKGNGNNWKFLYSDYKKEFFPSCVPTQEYIFNLDFCYYNRAVQAQMGDFYYNYFRLPNKDGSYKIVIKFNPQIKGCRAVKETNYSNNEETVFLEIYNGSLTIKK